ncbi:tRNA 2-selenouridine(34) synthase MnmH [Mariniblastus sp.]|nr:tRNA 2-selenouridine(34) synthase MnmH [Mariniblastus sp.]
MSEPTLTSPPALEDNSTCRELSADEFWQASRDGLLLDVRSPSEFEHGHIPGAVNLPLFDDDQRAEVGTIYRNSGKYDAVLRGLSIVGPKMADLAKTARAMALGRKDQVFVHCWRGGMRSRSMHWLLETAGLKPKLLSGGYKAFRNFAQTRFAQEWPLKVVSGLTGAGKTRILNVLAEHGESVIDLEGLANHRGSAFGAIGQNEPPTTEQFENLLFAELEQCSDAKRIWVEDEGNRLGTVVVPPAFIKQLKNSSAVFIDLSPAARVENLMDDYGDLSPDKLCESVQAIRKRLGFDLAQAATDAIESGEIKAAIEIVLGYYDRTYTHAAAKFPRPPMKELAIEGLTNQQLVDQMKAMV